MISQTFTHVVYRLAANTDYIEPLRQEATIVIDEGWKKTGLYQMRKVDSSSENPKGYMQWASVSEQCIFAIVYSYAPLGSTDASQSCQRLHVLRWYLYIPRCHTGQESYTDAERFDGIRFASIENPVPSSGKKLHMVLPQPDFVSFGYGKHACPGRFVAAAQLKLMLAHLVIEYDIRLKKGGVRPPDMFIASSRIPNQKLGEDLLRRRISSN